MQLEHGRFGSPVKKACDRKLSTNKFSGKGGGAAVVVAAGGGGGGGGAAAAAKGEGSLTTTRDARGGEGTVAVAVGG